MAVLPDLGAKSHVASAWQRRILAMALVGCFRLMLSLAFVKVVLFAALDFMEA
jgi:hypothetical protein